MFLEKMNKEDSDSIGCFFFQESKPK